MGFNLYLAGAENVDMDRLPENDCMGKLFTFALARKTLNKHISATKNCKIFLDSGAFSKFHSGVDINIDDYINYINSTPEVTVFAELDDIPFPILNTKTARESAEGSWKNYLYIMDRVKDEYRDKVIPIYHFGEPYDALERMLNTEVHGRLAPYIGLGGRHGVNKQAHDKYFEYVFKIVKRSKNPNVKIHAFGMTILDLLEKYPFHSADSTTWLMIGVNGNIITKTAGVIKVSNRSIKEPNSYWSASPHVKELIDEEVKNYGFTIEELAENYRARWYYNASYFTTWAMNYRYKPNTGVRRKRLF